MIGFAWEKANTWRREYMENRVVLLIQSGEGEFVGFDHLADLRLTEIAA